MGERRTVPQCVTCGSELHPERAKKYNYCMARECQEKNAKGLTIVAIGVNKAADEYLILDDRTRAQLASGKYHDQRRGSFGAPIPLRRPEPATAAGGTAPGDTTSAGTTAAGTAAPTCSPDQPLRGPVPRKVARRPWNKSQERLALLYNEQGMRPDEIARKLGLSTYNVTQIILTSKNRGKL
jgi:hypothetical protein